MPVKCVNIGAYYQTGRNARIKKDYSYIILAAVIWWIK